jgi:cysteine desulfurase
MQARRDQLWEGLKRAVEDPLRIKLNGHPENRLPNTLNVSFHSIEANTLLAQISEQVAASPGAACHAECIDVSHVLTAMNVPVEYAMGAVRFSVGKFTTEEQVDIAVEVVSKALQAYQS